MTKQQSPQQDEATPQANDHAAVKFPPPVLFLLLLGVALGLDSLAPAALGLPSALRITGAAIAIAGVGLAIHVAKVFRNRSTAIEPWKPSSALITEGVYGWTRNPIYLGFCLVNFGIGMAADSVWMMLSCLPGAWGVYVIAIAREESYLERRFGNEYLQYKQRVRRWL
jgi:protein-S-isoprenylcysteine O-methyltransferase Ste14